ncbi:MAG: hypothetical protein E7569_00405 [Ruminococcaceae bacterium]|nr:hypothetical protein [Oscillospiraceae bacterium]
MESNVTVHRVVRDKKKPGQYIEPHSHPFFHYLFGLAGHVRMHAAETDFIVPPGGLAMIPPGIEHSIHSLDDSCSLNIKFTCEGCLAKPAAQLPLFLPWVGDYQQVLLKNLLEEAVLQRAGSAELVSLRMYDAAPVESDRVCRTACTTSGCRAKQQAEKGTGADCDPSEFVRGRAGGGLRLPRELLFFLF